jgi:hypothetical protein
MKKISQDSRSPGRDLNPGPPEYEAGKRGSVNFDREPRGQY